MKERENGREEKCKPFGILITPDLSQIFYV